MEQLVNFVIRPPRAEYDPANDLLEQEFTLKGKLYQRKDLEVTNGRGDILKCSHYVPVVSPGDKPLPCVIFCHGNSGCRADASEAAIILLPSNITVFTLDFSGSGLSGGEYVTLGWNEKDDLKAVVDYLRADGNVSLIGLWGRSMGAVTSLMYGAEDPSIAGMILDSPFSALVDLMMELVDTYKIRLPKFTVKFAIHYMKKAIQKKAKFDIMDLNALKVAENCFVPVLLGHALDDDFIRPHHSDRIYEAYAGDKNIIKFEGDHNSLRPQFYFDSINIFFHNVLQPPEDEVTGTYLDSMKDYFDKGGWSSVPELGFTREPSPVPKDLGTSSTSNAIGKPHSRPPRSPEDLEGDDDSCASSSRMINFELSNGDPYGPHVPAVIDSDQYVEYELDDLRGFPSTAEEEEKMLLEAVMESLKDLNMHHPEPEEPLHDSGSSSFESSQIGDQETSSTREPCDTLKTESTSASLVNGHISSLDRSASSVEASFETPPSVLESETKGAPSPVNPSTNIPVPCTVNGDISSTKVQVPSSSDADVSSSTKATLTVVKNPANHIMDGLMRRWDLNFFKGNR